MNFRKNHLPPLILISLIMILYSCQKVEFKKESGAFEVFAEMVQAGVKPIALSQPLSPSEMDLFMPEATKIAEKYEISVFREPNLIGTSLFDSSVVQGKEVLILYKGESLEAYQMLKKEQMN
ncbi:hypothetical protein V8V91_12715 [Algoriphagus halophilus]|uniref:hypothetical protein n=1 Tax=Algoriphagus halophilus TaxID=226505 RepID=UPI00358E9C7F